MPAHRGQPRLFLNSLSASDEDGSLRAPFPQVKRRWDYQHPSSDGTRITRRRSRPFAELPYTDSVPHGFVIVNLPSVRVGTCEWQSRISHSCVTAKASGIATGAWQAGRMFN